MKIHKGKNRNAFRIQITPRSMIIEDQVWFYYNYLYTYRFLKILADPSFSHVLGNVIVILMYCPHLEKL